MEDELLYRAARELIRSEAFNEVMRVLREDAMAEFASSAPGDQVTRETAYFKQGTVTSIEQQVNIWAKKAS